MMTEEEGSKLGAVAPHTAFPPPREGPQDGSTWPREGVAFPVASPTSRGLLGPRAPLKEPPATLASATADAPTGEVQPAPKPRSGSENRQRQHVARVRLDDAERDKLEERAAASGLAVGAYLRACALETAGVRAKPRASVDRELLGRANADLNRVGNNINQIAHALNSGRDPPHVLAQAMDDLREVLAALRQAVGYDRQR